MLRLDKPPSPPRNNAIDESALSAHANEGMSFATHPECLDEGVALVGGDNARL
jgi:hypothetical protein